jgi:hypothetical protein
VSDLIETRKSRQNSLVQIAYKTMRIAYISITENAAHGLIDLGAPDRDHLPPAPLKKTRT